MSTSLQQQYPARRPPCRRWPYAGKPLTDQLRHTLHIPGNNDHVRLGTGDNIHEYSVINGYLIPYYDPLDSHVDQTLLERNEELIIKRSRAFIKNAQPGLGASWSHKDICAAIAEFDRMPERNDDECGEKVGQFRILVGVIMHRFEMLGRIINQRNSFGAKIEYDDLRKASVTPIDDKRRDELLNEFRSYYSRLAHPNLIPLWHSVLLSETKTFHGSEHVDCTTDHDGALIDLMREIGKPIRATTAERETSVRTSIVNKIGDAVQSIDQVRHDICRALMTDAHMKRLFENATKTFMKSNTSRYAQLASPQDLIARINHYADLCCAQACIRSDDPAYGEVFRQKSALADFFDGPNGLLASMRREGRNNGVEVSELRDILNHALKIMSRTANTRIPCNERAPEIFIPDMSEEASPMQQHLNHILLTDDQQEQAHEIFSQADKRQLTGSDRERYLQQQFCSRGLLQADIVALQRQLAQNEDIRQGPCRG